MSLSGISSIRAAVSSSVTSINLNNTQLNIWTGAELMALADFPQIHTLYLNHNEISTMDAEFRRRYFAKAFSKLKHIIFLNNEGKPKYDNFTDHFNHARTLGFKLITPSLQSLAGFFCQPRQLKSVGIRNFNHYCNSPESELSIELEQVKIDGCKTT